MEDAKEIIQGPINSIENLNKSIEQYINDILLSIGNNKDKFEKVINYIEQKILNSSCTNEEKIGYSEILAKYYSLKQQDNETILEIIKVIQKEQKIIKDSDGSSSSIFDQIRFIKAKVLEDD